MKLDSIAGLIAGTVVSLSVVGAVISLGWHGRLDGQTISALLGAIIGGGIVHATNATRKS